MMGSSFSLPTLDLFISYAHADADEVQPWIDRLRADGFSLWTDQDQLLVGSSLSEAITEGVESTYHTLVFLSPAYLAGKWTAFESQVSRVLDPDNRRRRILPVKIKPCEVPLAYRAFYYADLTGSRDSDAEYKKIAQSVSPRHLLVADFSLFTPDTDPSMTSTTRAYFEPETLQWRMQVNKPGRQHVTFPNRLFTGNVAVSVTAARLSGPLQCWYGIAIVNAGEPPYSLLRFLVSGLGTYSYEIATFANGIDQDQTELRIVKPAQLSSAIGTHETRNRLQLTIRDGVAVWSANRHVLLTEGIAIESQGSYEIGLIAVTLKEHQSRHGDSGSIEIAFEDLQIDAVR